MFYAAEVHAALTTAAISPSAYGSLVDSAIRSRFRHCVNRRPNRSRDHSFVLFSAEDRRLAVAPEDNHSLRYPSGKPRKFQVSPLRSLCIDSEVAKNRIKNRRRSLGCVFLS